ncbi:hypothetical protein FB567DRAFT_508959 [Paraphoma chrysanthemicola]|uniref:Uncharacterized protein n=1 Tax=Paraphoma chrysanthemicola TaxID=798071 RepID=A0A8K0QSQ6_9PLEO|nr:hypothetical protein FB567DRAFT_508959 [Paraphoma chrysanthemicola]
MLLFKEHKPIEDGVISSTQSRTAILSQIGPLQQLGSCAFIPYHNHVNPESISSSTTTTSTSQTLNDCLKIHNTSSWTYSGPLLPGNSTSLPPSFHAWSAVTLSSPSQLLSRLLPLLSFLESFLRQTGVECYWLTIRASTPTTDYNEPRWHVDDDFFASDFDGRAMQADDTPTSSRTKANDICSGKRWKLCTTLLGPSTLFAADNESALQIVNSTKAQHRKTNQHTCTSIRCLGCATYASCVRTSLARSLRNHTTTSPAPNEVAFFRLGSDHGAVHSEPKCDVDRIFVNVVPGTEGELRGLLGKWGMGWPRAWCVRDGGFGIRSDEAESFGKR